MAAYEGICVEIERENNNPKLTDLLNIIIPPKRSLGGYIGVTRWSVGWAGGRSVGPAVRCVFLFQYNFIQ